MAAVRLCLEYGIGLPTKQSQEIVRGQLIVQPKYPIGTDPLAMRRLEADILARAGVQPPGAPPKRNRGRIFNDALLQAVGGKDKVQPKEVKDALTTAEGDTLEIVTRQRSARDPGPRAKGARRMSQGESAYERLKRFIGHSATR